MDESVRRVAQVLWLGVAICLAAGEAGCHADHPSREQIQQVNRLVGERVPVTWDVGLLFQERAAAPPAPIGELTLRDAMERALARNLALLANAENLSIAHAQTVQAGLFQNPVIGQSSGLLFPISPAGGYPSVDGNIQQVLNTFFTQPTKVRIAKYQEVQADIDLSLQAFALAQQVAAKYQEMIRLLRARKLAVRVMQLYERAVRAAEARQRVGIIPTPELNRARLNYDDGRRQVQHLTSQYQRAAREMNWLIGYPSAPLWHLPNLVVEDVSTVPALVPAERLEKLALQYRLDLLRADFDRKLADRGVKQAKLAIIPQITVGAEVARDSSHNLTGGPWLVGIALPIFDPGIVNLELAYAQRRKALKTYLALAGQVRQDVRTAFDNWRIAADDVNFYRSRLIPQQEENIRLMEISFRLGNDDLDTLLNVYQNYVTQLQGYEDSIQAYHDSGVSLEQSVGLMWDRIVQVTGMRGGKSATTTNSRAATRPATTAPGEVDLPPLPPLPEPTTAPANQEPIPTTQPTTPRQGMP